MLARLSPTDNGDETGEPLKRANGESGERGDLGDFGESSPLPRVLLETSTVRPAAFPRRRDFGESPALGELLPDLKRLGKTIIVISHDDRYFDTADKVVHLSRGKVVEALEPA